MRPGGAVHALQLWISGFDDVVLVGGVRAISMAQSKVTGGEAQRIAGENVTRPGAGEAWKHYRVDAIAAVDCRGCANYLRVRRCGGGVVTSAHVNIDVREAVFRQVGLERCKGFGRGHVWYEPQIHFRHGFSGQDRFTAWSGVAADQPFDIYGGPSAE